MKYRIALFSTDYCVRFIRGLPIEFFAYDHSNGIADGPKNIIKPCSVLIVDGIHAMHERIKPLINYSIFVCADDKQLQHIRHRADITKRNQTIKFSKSDLDSELEKYQMHVAPYKNKANLVLTLINEWQYNLSINDS